MTIRQRAPRRPIPQTPPPAPVAVARVSPEVLEVARELAGGDPARLEIRSPVEVVVHNGPGWSQGRRGR